MDAAVVDGVDGLFLAVKDAGRAGVALHFRRHGAALDHAAVGGQVAPQNLQTAGLAVGVVDGTDGLLVQDMGALDVLTQRLAGDGGHIQIQQALLGQLGLHRRNAAGLVQVGHVGGTGRGQMAEVGGLGTDLVEDLQIQRHARLMGDGQQVQHRVGGAAQGHVAGQGVADGALVDDLAGR